MPTLDYSVNVQNRLRILLQTNILQKSSECNRMKGAGFFSHMYMYIKKLQPNLSHAELHSPTLYVCTLCLCMTTHAVRGIGANYIFIFHTLIKLKSHTNLSNGWRHGGWCDFMLGVMVLVMIEIRFLPHVINEYRLLREWQGRMRQGWLCIVESHGFVELIHRLEALQSHHELQRIQSWFLKLA